MWSPDLFDKCMAASFPSSDGADNLIKSGGVVLLLWGQSIKAGQLTLINYIYISIIDEENTLQLSGNQKLWSLSINSHVHYWFISRPISHPGKPGKSLLTNIANMADAFQQIWQPPSSKYGSCLPANMGDAFQQIWLMPSSKYGICLPAVLKSLAHYQLFCSSNYLPSIFLLEKTATTIFRFYHQFLFPDSL